MKSGIILYIIPLNSSFIIIIITESNKCQTITFLDNITNNTLLRNNHLLYGVQDIRVVP